MLRQLVVGACLLSLILLAACSSGVPSTSLPTATLAPTQVIPTVTSTPQPPPTVTPYPTVTPRAAEPTTELTAESADQTPEAGETASAATTAPPPTAGISTEPRGEQLFRTDFSRGWPAIDEVSAKIEIVDGQYQFEIGPFDARFMSTSVVEDGDIFAQVEVNVTDCPERSGYGLIFRQEDDSNYYAFMIFCQNSYSLIARVNGSLGIGGPMASGALPSGLTTQSGSHTLAVQANGSAISILFDGQSLAEVTDDRHSSGDIALYVFSESTNIIQVAFDNLEVWAAE